MSQVEGVEERRDRELAQAGSIAGAIFAALVAADPFDIRHRFRWAQYVDYAAIVLWMLAVLLFLYAASAPLKAPNEAAERRQAGARFKLAMTVAAGAGLLTAAGLAMTALGVSLDTDQARLSVSRSEERALEQLCGRPLDLKGSIPTSTLSEEFITFTFHSRTPSGCDAVRIPRSALLAIREHPP